MTVRNTSKSKSLESVFAICCLLLAGSRLEEELTAEIAHLRQRVAQVEMINQARRRDLVLLTQHVNRSLPWSTALIYSLKIRQEIGRLLT